MQAHVELILDPQHVTDYGPEMNESFTIIVVIVLDGEEMWSHQSKAHEAELRHRHGHLRDNVQIIVFRKFRSHRVHLADSLQRLP